MTINGINDCVNRTCIRTTLQRLYTYHGYKTLIVDAYGWLHAAKHVNGVAELISCGLPCPPLLAFFERRISTLSLGGKFKIIPVFDGPSSIQKHGTDTDRQQSRADKRAEGLRLRTSGDSKKSRQLLLAAIEITPSIAKEVVDHLNNLSPERKKQIGFHKCVTSINEADPMLSHLNNTIAKSCVISQDFDCVPWNVKACCFKVDYGSGIVHLFLREVFDVSAVVSRRLLQVSHRQLIDICVLAGCDYVKNIKGMAFVKAVNCIRQHGSAMKVLAQWRKEKKPGCTDEYVLAVRRAITMFRYCWVVDEAAKEVVNINPYAEACNSPFSIDLHLDPKPDNAIALGIHLGELHPMTAIWENDQAPQRDPLRTFGADDLVEDEDTCDSQPVSSSGCNDESILQQFHLKEFPPYDRPMTKAELQSFLVLPEAEVPNAGIFSASGKWDRQKTLKLFMCWKRRGYVRPTLTSAKLKLFLRTRGKIIHDAEKEILLDMCEYTLADEASRDVAVRLYHTPYDDGLAEKKRKQALIEAHILTPVNAPGQVPPPIPKLTCPKWTMLKVCHCHTHSHTHHHDTLIVMHTCMLYHLSVHTHMSFHPDCHARTPFNRDCHPHTLKVEWLDGIAFPDVLTDWLSVYLDDFSALMRKAQGAWSSGKAYAIKAQKIAEFLYIWARVGQSFSNASSKAYNAVVVFKNNAICYSRCPCVGGDSCGICHHVVQLLIGLMQFRMRIIKVGQYNGGDRAWGQGRLLIDMPSLESYQIALLFPGQHALRLFPGIKTKFATLTPRMGNYLRFLQTYGTDCLEKTVNEIHHGVEHPNAEPIRRGLELPDWDFDACYRENKLVLESV